MAKEPSIDNRLRTIEIVDDKAPCGLAVHEPYEYPPPPPPTLISSLHDSRHTYYYRKSLPGLARSIDTQ